MLPCTVTTESPWGTGIVALLPPHHAITQATQTAEVKEQSHVFAVPPSGLAHCIVVSQE